MKPIPAHFNGFRFRTGLEARWAIFFEALGIEFHHEPEVFQDDATRYLADFFLPKVRMYAKVKPTKLTADELDKCSRQTHASGANGVVLLIGPPSFKPYPAIEQPAEPGCPYMTDVCLDIDYHVRKYYEDEHRFYSACGGQFEREEEFTPEYQYAVYKSRSARFGEAA